MKRLRRALGPIVAVWLSCHLGQLGIAPVVFWTDHGDGVVECTCAHGEHAVCPMHHKSKPGSTICYMQSTSSEDTVLVSSVLTVLGLPAVAPELLGPPSWRGSQWLADFFVSPRPVAPDPPPPRV